MAGLGRWARVMSELSALQRFLQFLQPSIEPEPPTRDLDEVEALAPHDPKAALARARTIPQPLLRCRAFATLARHAMEEDVDAFAQAALAAAATGNDDFVRATMTIYPIAALLARGHADAARDMLAKARMWALSATPNSSRAEALFRLMEASWDLDAATRIELLDDLIALHARDTFWRIGRAVVDALGRLGAVDRDLAESIAQRIPDAKCRAKALARIQAPFPVRLRDFF